MKNYVLIWILLITLLIGVGYIALFGYDALPKTSVAILFAGTAGALLLIANELKRPQIKEYHRQRALYPAVPEEYLYDSPPEGGMVFGIDYRTNKLVGQEKHHTLIIGSTGSGKTSCSLLPSILSNSKGSAQIVDIKSRELSLKASDIYDPNTIIIRGVAA